MIKPRRREKWGSFRKLGKALQNSRLRERNESPVFVVGCHRSGTNLLYDTLLSAGGFAIYRGYLPIYKMLIPRFGDLDNPENRKKIINTWLRSKGFRRSGLDAQQLMDKLLAECNNGGDFIRIVMDAITRNQSAARWAVYDPDNLLHMQRIKADIPEALFVHVIRDGRDIALSLSKMQGFTPFPWNRKSRGLRETALYWEWMVRKGRQYGRLIGNDYIEVRYEELASEPEGILKKLGKFLDHDLDYERIQSMKLGRLSESNSSFRQEAEEKQSNPVNRWRERLSAREVAGLESMVGDCLTEFGYSLSLPEKQRQPGIQEQWMRLVYRNYLDAKLWLKIKTPAGRFASLSELELLDSAATADSAQMQ
jgi:LPS sulfotransferase NodH